VNSDSHTTAPDPAPETENDTRAGDNAAAAGARSSARTPRQLLSDRLRSWLPVAIAWTPVAAAAALLVVFVSLSRFTGPQADDFDFAVMYHRYGFFGSQKAWAYGWNGRYFSNAILSVTLGHLALLRAYWLFPVLGFVGSAVTVLYVLRALFPRAAPRALCMSAAVWFAFYLLNAPRKADTFYWITGIFTYPIANVALALFALHYVRMFTLEDQRERRRALLVAAFWIFVTVGCNETSMVLLLIVLGVGLVGSLLFARHHFVPCSILLAVAGACTAAVMLSPGNAVREAFMGPHKLLVPTLTNAWTQFKESVATWTLNALLYAMTIRFFRPIQSIGLRITKLHPILRQPVVQALAVLVGLAGIFATIATSWWATGMPIIPRTLNITYFAFIYTWFIGVAFIGAFWVGKVSLRGKARLAASAMASLWLAYALLAHPWVKGGIDELTTTGPIYRRDLLARYALVKRAHDAGERTVVVPPRTKCPPNVCIRNGDISSCAAGWPNSSYSEWFDMESVRLPGSPYACPPLPQKAFEVVNPYSMHLFRKR
jgi:hypothetical protein